MKKNISLKSYNSFGVDVISKEFYEVSSEAEVIKTLKLLKNKKVFILGGGTNILFTSNVQIPVINVKIKGIKIISENNNYVNISIGAGEIWDDFVKWAIAKNLGGVENLISIPGYVGGAPIQNIGAYGVEIKDIFISCSGYFLNTLEKKKFKLNDCQFSYRSSIFKKSLKNKFIITEVVLQLSKTNHKISKSYKSINDALNKKKIQNPSIKDIARIVSKIRENKLPNPSLIGNSGSFFKNPIVSVAVVNKLKQKFSKMVYFKESVSKYKLSAAWLIENCNFKNIEEKNVGVYKNQALVIINLGNATGKEILLFSKKIKSTVLEKFDILLEEEVNII